MCLSHAYDWVIWGSSIHPQRTQELVLPDRTASSPWSINALRKRHGTMLLLVRGLIRKHRFVSFYTWYPITISCGSLLKSCPSRSAQSTLPAREPTTTAIKATNKALTPNRCPCGSMPLTAGAMYKPVASHEVAIQKMPICRCHVRATEYGNHFANGMP